MIAQQHLALALLLVVCRPGVARAQQVLVVAEQESPATRRCAAELDGLDLEPLFVAMVPPLDAGALSALARDRGAIAAIAVVGAAGRYDIWVVDRVTGKALLREVVLEGDDPDGGELALRAVELLRASLLELEAPHPSRGAVPAPPEIERLLSPSEPSTSRSVFSIELGASAQWSSVDRDPLPSLVVGGRARPDRWLGVALRLSVDLVPTVLVVPEGTAELRGGSVMALVVVHVLEHGSPLDLFIEAGLVVTWLEARGTAVAPYEAAGGLGASAGVAGRVGLATPAESPVQGLLFGGVDALFAPLEARAVGRSIATLGLPAFAIGLGLRVSIAGS